MRSPCCQRCPSTRTDCGRTDSTRVLDDDFAVLDDDFTVLDAHFTVPNDHFAVPDTDFTVPGAHVTVLDDAPRVGATGFRGKTLKVFRLDGESYRMVHVWRDEAVVRAEPFDAIELDLAILWAR